MPTLAVVAAQGRASRPSPVRKRLMSGLVLVLVLGLALGMTQPAGAEPAGADTRYTQRYYREESYLEAYRRAVRHYNPALGAKAVDRIVTAVLHYSDYYLLDPRLVTALIAVESRFRPEALSPAGARGLGQLMPGTARSEGVDPEGITSNIHGSCRVIRRNLDRYRSEPPGRRLVLALAAYNAGPGAVQQHGGVPPYPETQEYVRRVMEEYRRLSGH